MIVKMKKVSLVVLESKRDESLTELGKLGVVHIHTGSGNSEELQNLLTLKSNIEKALFRIAEEGSEEQSDSGTLDDAREVMETISGIIESSRQLQDDLERLQREEAQLSIWGNFDPGDIRELRDKGIDIRLFDTTGSEYKRLEDAPFRFIVSESKSRVLFADIVLGERLEPDREEVQLPERGLASVHEEIRNKEQMIQENQRRLKELGSRRNTLQNGLVELDEKIRFEQVQLDMQTEDDFLAYLTGYVPVPKIDVLKKEAVKQGWALLLEDPSEEDQVPTLIENSKPVRIIKPVFRILETIPGYREYDISLWFLLFFTLFFSIIVGDAGYGFIFLIIGIFMGIKRRAITDGVKLLFFLSFCTMTWGAITGTWFGSERIASLKPFSLLIVEPIASGNPKSGETIKLLCFIIGTTQLLLAHVQNFIKQLPRLKSIAQLGWLSTMLGLYYLVLNLVLDPVRYPMPSYALYMILAGFFLILVFAQQEKGVSFIKGLVKGVGGLLTTFLDGIGAFSDIISYIRLFAVGLATVAIAQSFNAMAANMSGGVAGIVGAAFILAFGHGLNLVMAMLSVVVHGVRLNMLEFSGHLGMEWSGFNYEPFRVRKI